MAHSPQLELRPRTITSNRDLTYRPSLDLASPLILIMAIIAYAAGLSFMLTMDWSATPNFPTMAETLPAPDISAQVPPAPPTPPANP